MTAEVCGTQRDFLRFAAIRAMVEMPLVTAAALLARLRQPALRRAVVLVVLRIDGPHGPLAQPLLVRVGYQPRHARDDEQRVPEFVIEAEVGADGRDRAIHV